MYKPQSLEPNTICTFFGFPRKKLASIYLNQFNQLDYFVKAQCVLKKLNLIQNSSMNTSTTIKYCKKALKKWPSKRYWNCSSCCFKIAFTCLMLHFLNDACCCYFKRGTKRICNSLNLCWSFILVRLIDWRLVSI